MLQKVIAPAPSYRFSRALVGMVMHTPETNEIAKPSELLASVKTYMSVLQTVEYYGM